MKWFPYFAGQHLIAITKWHFVFRKFLLRWRFSLFYFAVPTSFCVPGDDEVVRHICTECISNTRDSVSSGYPNTEKRVENKTCNGVYLTKFEVFGEPMKHCFECLIYLLNGIEN